MSEGAWRTSLRLRDDDLDYLGHVTAAAYLRVFEEARVIWLQEAWSLSHPAYVVARQELVYRRGLLLADNPVSVTVTLARLGKASFDVEEMLLSSSGELKTESRATLVAWDRERRCSRPLEEAERAGIEASQRSA